MTHDQVASHGPDFGRERLGTLRFVTLGGMVLLMAGCAAATSSSGRFAVPQGVTFQHTDRPYLVHGETVEQIELGLGIDGPGTRPYEFTWFVRWNYTYGSPGGTTGDQRCVISDLDLTITYSSTYPEWTPLSGVPAELALSWDSYVEGVRVHGDGHRAIAFDAAREMQGRIGSLESPDCAFLERDARRLMEEILARHNQLNADYHQETAGGRDQGALWPPASSATRTLWTLPGRSAAEGEPVSIEEIVAKDLIDSPVDQASLISRSILDRSGDGPTLPPNTVMTGSPTGLVLALYHDGQVEYLDAHGARGPQSVHPLNATELFPFPAFGELLVSAAARALSEVGGLDLEAPLSTYLTGLDDQLGSVPVRLLLDHSGGLDDAALREGQTWDQALSLLDGRALMTEPGALPSRSRYSFPLLRMVLEAATSRPLSEVISQSLLVPLGMRRTTFDSTAAVELGLAEGNLIRGDSVQDRSGTSFEGMPVVFTSAPDVMQFLVAWNSGMIRGASPTPTLNMAPTQTEGHFTDGAWSDAPRGIPAVWRACTALGFSAGFFLFPESGSLLVLWANGTWARDTHEYALRRLTDALGGDESVPLVTPFRGVSFSETNQCVRRVADEVAPSEVPASADDWPGTYRNGDRLVLLGEVGDQLVYGQNELPMRQVGGGLFQVLTDPTGNGRFPVRLNRDGAGRRYVVLQGKAYLHREDETTR